MNADRIKEIQAQTAYPDSQSVTLALFQVWNECTQEAAASTPPTYAQGQEELVAENAELRQLLSEARTWIEDAKESSAIDAAFREGQDEMRERVVKIAEAHIFEDHVDCDGCRTAQMIAKVLRALPIKKGGGRER